jgi:mRNA interferase RelE/StbE
MKFQIIWSESAANELKKLDRAISKRIYIKVSKLVENPYHNVIKMAEDPYFRLPAGDYRVIFDIQNDRLRILIVKVGHRKNIYKK